MQPRSRAPLPDYLKKYEAKIAKATGVVRVRGDATADVVDDYVDDLMQRHPWMLDAIADIMAHNTPSTAKRAPKRKRT